MRAGRPSMVEVRGTRNPVPSSGARIAPGSSARVTSATEAYSIAPSRPAATGARGASITAAWRAGVASTTPSTRRLDLPPGPPTDRPGGTPEPPRVMVQVGCCLLYTSDAADEEDSVDLGGRRIIKK